MADTERHFGPTIDLQGFDLRTDMDTIEESTRFPLLIVIGLVVLAAFAGVVWLAYIQGVERGRESVSREVIAQSLWTARKSDAPAYTGLKIYEQPHAGYEKPTSAVPIPPKEVAGNEIPALRPIASATPDNLALAAPAKPVARTTSSAQVGTSLGAHAATVAANPATAKPKAVESKAAETAVNPLQRVATRAPTDLTKPATAAPAITHPITGTDSLPPPSTAPKPAMRSAPPPPPAPAASPASTAQPVHTEIGGILLQIGSYKSEAEARTSWNAFKTEHEAASPYQPDVKQVDLGAKGTWYRLRMGPFADRKTALQTCAKLKADGASCLLSQ